MSALVIRSTGSFYDVLTDAGERVSCKVKGNFRLRGIRSTNPVAVGDRVAIRREGETAFITEVEERRNCITRRASNLSKQSHILAANIDLALLLVTIARPETSTTFADRFLATAEAYRVPAIIVFNKCDDLTEEEELRLSQYEEVYVQAGYETFRISALSGEGLPALRERLSGYLTLLVGNSGVGKSTLLNALVPEAHARTQDISATHQTGMHTTTHSELFPLASGGGLIDIPGIKGFGTIDFDPREVSHYFRDIFRISKACRFYNCTHTHEPGCAVLEAVSNGKLPESRYQSYLSILQDKDESKYRKPQ